MKTTSPLRYEPAMGETIQEAARQMIGRAGLSGATFIVDFNGFEISATAESTVEEVVAQYHDGMKAKSDAYAASPEGKAAAAKWEAERQSNQAEADRLMSELDALNFADYNAVLWWLLEFQPLSDNVTVTKDWRKVRRLLEEHGYKENENTKETFDPGNQENEARYLIGQALAGFNFIGAMHPILVNWIATYFSKWQTTQQQPN